MIALNAALKALQVKYDSQGTRLGQASSEQAENRETVDRLRGDLAHLREESSKQIVDLRTLLDETLHALAAEKMANDLELEEVGRGLARIKKIFRSN